MGGSLDAERGSPLRVRVRVEGEAALDSVEIVRDRTVRHSTRGDGRLAEFEFLDRSEAGQGRDFSYVYVRVKQVDGHYAWASPVWVDWR